jgi:hypothetical protein
VVRAQGRCHRAEAAVLRWCGCGTGLLFGKSVNHSKKLSLNIRQNLGVALSVLNPERR